MSRSDAGPGADTVHPAETAASHDHDANVSRIVSTLEHLAETGVLSTEQIRSIVSATIKLYAAASERAGQELPPVTHDVSTTDALTLACALVRSQDLTPFEMAVWFSRGRHPE
jgi:hypothetical protein